MVFSVQWRTKEEEEIGLTSRPELGCNMPGFLFLMVIDWIMRKTVRYGESGIRWKLQSKPDNLDFADNVALLSSIRQHMQHKGTRMDEAAKRVGLRINQTKTKVLSTQETRQNSRLMDRELKSSMNSHIFEQNFARKEVGMEDLQYRLSKARSTFARFKVPITPG